MQTLGWLLGFRNPTYDNIVKEIVSEGLFDGGGDRYIYLSLNDYHNNKNIDNIVGLQSSILNKDILAKIPMTNGKLSLIIDNTNNLAKIRKYNGPVNLNKLNIQVLDKFGNIINLNNMDFSFTLEVELLYESFNFKDVFA
jgi:replicative DNA helicase